MSQSDDPEAGDESLPGGAIGPAETNADGTRTWTRASTDGAPHQPDEKLDRTAVRWTDGWYLVTADPATGEATWRQGPFTDCGSAESALLKLADSANTPTHAKAHEQADAPTNGATETPSTDDPDGFDTPHDLPDSVYDRAEQICNEGQAKRLYDAFTRWQALAEQTKAERADKTADAEHCENTALGASGDASPAEVRQAHDLVLEAARSYDHWLVG